MKLERSRTRTFSRAAIRVLLVLSIVVLTLSGTLGQRLPAAHADALALSPATLPAGQVGVAYSQIFTASGGDSAYTFTTTGTLPDGLSLVDNLDGTATLSGTPTTAVASPFTVSVKVTDGALITTPAAVAPAITLNPVSQSIVAGSQASFTAAASGNPTPTVQWQISINGGSTFTNIPDATSATYAFAARGLQSGYQYRAVFSNGTAPNTATSDTAVLTVTPYVPQPPNVPPYVAPTSVPTDVATSAPTDVATTAPTVAATAAPADTFVSAPSTTPAVGSSPTPVAALPTAVPATPVATAAPRPTSAAVTINGNSLSLSVDADTSVPGEPVTLTAQLSALGSQPASLSASKSADLSGNVTFKDGDTVLGSAALVNGKATLTTTKLGSGVHSLTVTLNGQKAGTNATTPPLVVVAQKAGTVISVLVLHNLSKTVTGGRTTACAAKLNSSAGVQKGCELISSDWLAGAKVTYTLTYANGKKQVTSNKADVHGHSLGLFSVSYMPKVVKKGTARETVTVTVQALLPNGTTAGSTKIRFAVQR